MKSSSTAPKPQQMQSIKESAELWASRRFFIELWDAPTFVLLAFRLRSVFEGVSYLDSVVSVFWLLTADA